ncbi:siderophore-interacting protein [Alteromonas gracilis]|uniref:Siderophore-interacting protein n=1 Tax=Alteromonas gracilis TaxID=1479524 RepID=A0ABX5CJL3_9ALTE|nr:siderophore-interacting protein [Alteromonas gracilis]PRO67573.1 siderophore-interacting protein [Alteromonas gracilis]
MSRPQPRHAVVTRSVRITPTMQRVYLGGDDLRTFPTVTAGAYVKLMFDKNGNPLSKPTDMSQVAMRTYTVAQSDAHKPELVLDMVIHANNGKTGPASAWAISTKPGDIITLAGPGSSKGLNEHYDWVLLAGDMTALPSIRNHLTELPSHAKGYAVIRIEDEKDAVVLKKPEGIEVIWEFENSLPHRLTQLNWQEGTPTVWVACEFSDMRAIRTWLKDEKNVAHENIYISSYWKKGRSEDQHKIEKRQDSEAFSQSLN